MLDTLHSARGQLAWVYLALALGLWISTLLNVAQATAFRYESKGLWVRLLLLAPGIGVPLYLAVGRPARA